MVFTCRACGRNTPRGAFMLHLQNSRNPHCQAYLQQIISELPDSSESDEDKIEGSWVAQPRSEPELMHVEMNSGHDSEAPAVESQGDFFGDYRDYDEREFGMDVDTPGGESEDDDVNDQMDETGGGDETDDDDHEFGIDTAADDADDADLDGSLEPSRPMRLPTPDSDLNIENDNGGGVTNNRAEIEQKLKNHPFVVKFGGRAGLPVTQNQTILTQVSDDLKYGSTLGKSDNIYAPFSSHIEWEIACWAKLRGPSSTAFSELMMIEGVSNSILNI